MSFLNTLLHNCQQYSAKNALEFMGDTAATTQTITYGELEAAVQQTMAFLVAHGLQTGDRVALQLPKSMAFIYLHLATMRLGGISLPLNPGYPQRELLYFLEDAEASLFFADTAERTALEPTLSQLPSLRHTFYLDDHHPQQFMALIGEAPPLANLPAIPSNPHDTALMIYTSGTTGRPKGAEITHGNLTAQIEALHEAWGWQSDDVLLHVLPIFHVHGLTVALHGALHAGATAVLVPKFHPEEALELLEKRQCTLFMAVPTIHRRLLDVSHAHSYDLSHMRLFTSGSDRLPDDLFIGFQRIFGHTLLERYGMSETGMNLSNPLHGERRIGSVGLPLPGVEARVVDPTTEQPVPDGTVGEVQIRGPHVCKGYWRQPDKTAAAFTADGWLRTGDLGLRGADGYFTLKGRSKDLIISGGFNIYPPEVELVLSEYPAVATCAVIGCPDDRWGEQVTAVVTLRGGYEPTEATAEEIIDHCRRGLIGYKIPRRIFFVEELPRNALGKVQKTILRDQVCGQ